MAQQTINIGAAPDDHTGDNPRVSFDKANQNFTELYEKGATEGLWNYNKTSTDTTTAPVSGRFKTNSGNYRDATQIAIHAVTIQNIDRSSTLRTLLVGDLIQCQDSSNPAAWCRFAVQSLPVDHTTWFQVNVTLQADGGVASGDNQEIVFVFTAAATAGGGTATLVPPQGRLTLQSATPVMTTTLSAKTTIYYSAYAGDKVPIFDGANWTMTAITGGEISVSTTDTTKSPAAIGASKCNDWFVWNDAGTIRLSHGPDWTSDTARSAGTALTLVNGIYLNNAAITNGPAASRGTYVGTTRSNGSSQLDWIYGAVAASGTAGFFGVWNAYNRRLVRSINGDSADNWTYALLAVRAANGSNTMRHSFVSGLAEDAFEASYTCAANLGTSAAVGVCYDVTNALSGRKGWNQQVSGSISQLTGEYGTTALGFHFFQAGESAGGTTSANFFGDNGSTGLFQSGMLFRGWM